MKTLKIGNNTANVLSIHAVGSLEPMAERTMEIPDDQVAAVTQALTPLKENGSLVFELIDGGLPINVGRVIPAEEPKVEEEPAPKKQKQVNLAAGESVTVATPPKAKDQGTSMWAGHKTDSKAAHAEPEDDPRASRRASPSKKY